MLDLKSFGENMVASSAATFRHTDDWSKILWECSLPDWLGTITVWSNGCCDYDWLFLSSKEAAFAHCEGSISCFLGSFDPDGSWIRCR
jgi:hypothetical protein